MAAVWHAHTCAQLHAYKAVRTTWVKCSAAAHVVLAMPSLTMKRAWGPMECSTKLWS
jgi:hypothetical protein